MKFLLIALGLNLSLFMGYSFAEKVVCYSERQVWEVSFELEGSLVSNLEFKKNGNVVRSYSQLEANVTRFFKRKIYNLNLGVIRYFDFTRSIGQSSFAGEFLLSSNPLHFETPVSCTAFE